jgi:hypothetical protein
MSEATSPPVGIKTRIAAVLSLLLLPVPAAVGLLTDNSDAVLAAAAFQLLLSIATGISLIILAVKSEGRPRIHRILSVVALSLIGLGGLGSAFLGTLSIALGAAWGRPLRVRGRQLFPQLREGADWTRGARPEPSALDDDTRRALEALWLHDAQKEHASVPAFSRISWMLAAVGAPAELMIGAHEAALEEIDHARRCFALAAGYGGRSHTVEPMPDLLLGGMDLKGDPMATLAVESLKDGCLLEDFNADVAARCVAVCREPATRDVLERIAREERSHAEFSWRVLEWTLERGGPAVRRAVVRALAELDGIRRPTSVSADKAALVAAADPQALLANGRIPDAQWAECWAARLDATRERAGALLNAPEVALASK